MFPTTMRTVRSRLAVLTLLLLAQQTLALALAGALACCEPQSSSPATAQMECCKKGGDGHICPVTNRRAPDRGCRMKSGCSTEVATALAGAGFLYAAPLVGRFSIIAPVVQRPAWARVVDEPPLANTPPPTPPPKA